MWQMGGLGPMQGQANHFNREYLTRAMIATKEQHILMKLGPCAGYAPEKIQYGIDRYLNETRRLYRTMDTHLAKQSSGFLVGDKCTIADIACWGWVAAGCKITNYPLLPFPQNPPPPPPSLLSHFVFEQGNNPHDMYQS